MGAEGGFAFFEPRLFKILKVYYQVSTTYGIFRVILVRIDPFHSKPKAISVFPHKETVLCISKQLVGEKLDEDVDWNDLNNFKATRRRLQRSFYYCQAQLTEARN